MRGKNVVKMVLYQLFCFVICLIFVNAYAALDAPHNPASIVGCLACHDMASTQPKLLPPLGRTPVDIDETTANVLCWQCHNGGSSPPDAPYVLTHSSLTTSNRLGDWTVECWVCHSQHANDQFRSYGAAAYAYSAVANGVTASTLSVAGTPWTADQYTGYTLVPNIAQQNFSYKIVSNTANTLNIRGAIDLSKASAGKTFAIAYGKFIRKSINLATITGKPKTGTKTVKFFQPTGTNSFADGDATLNGICEVCHSETSHHRNTPDGDHSHYPGQDCLNCHNHENGFGHGGSGGIGCGDCHHKSAAAANTNCTSICHKSVDHTAIVAPVTPCIECHTDTAGTTTGIPVSLVDPKIHNSCRTCHTFDTDMHGILVDFTNKKGVLGAGTLPNGGTIGGKDGGGACTVCHTQTPPEAYHHNSPQTKIGQCEACHVDPRPTWGPNAPGDNGTAAGLAQARPTQMACLKCHVLWSGGNMLVTKFERASYTSFRTLWTRTYVHTIPMDQTRINNFGICLSCHYVGSPKVLATPVTLWHAHPSQKGGASWQFYDQDWDETLGKTYLRGSGSFANSGDTAHYTPGRSPALASSTAPRSGISGFNLFEANYGAKDHTLPFAQSYYTYRSEGKDSGAYYTKAWDTPAFTRIAIPTNAKIGLPASATLNDTTRAVPVFASLAPLTATPSTPDDIKVKYAIYNGSNLSAAASTSGVCPDLTLIYGASTQTMTGSPSNCTATISSPAYPGSGATLNVTTTNPLGLDVIGFPISEPNPGTLSFSSSTYAIDENTGTGMVTITVTRTNGYSGAVGVTYTTLATGTATAGDDYTFTTDTLSWSDGDTADKTFTVSIVDDPTAEVDETINLALSSPTGGAKLGRSDTAELTIIDESSPAGTIAFAASKYTVAENGDSVTITATRTGGSMGEVSVTYTMNPHLSTAKAGSDFIEAKGTLTWTDGDTTDKTFTITTLTHNEIRGDKNINLYLFAPTGGAHLGTPNFTDVTILSNAIEVLDPWPTAPQLTGTTGNLSGTFNIGIGGNRLLVVAVSCSDTSASGQTFSATYGGKALTQAFIENSNHRQTWFGYLKEADLASRSNNTITVSINGNHTSVAAFVTSYRKVNQVQPIAGKSGSYNYHSFTSPSYVVASSQNPPIVATGGYGFYNWAGDATYERLKDNEDYNEHADLVLGDMQLGIASKPFYTEKTTSGYVSWTSSAVNRYKSASLVTLNSHAGPVALSFSTKYPYVFENGTTAAITVSRLGSAAGAVGVNYATTTGGSAVAGVHYYPASGTLAWADGDMADKTIPVTIIDNQDAGGMWPQVNLALSSPTGGAIMGPSATAVLTIQNDDVETHSSINFTTSTTTVSESGATATISVTRSASTIGTVGVSYATITGGTATAGTDYQTTAGTLSWADGESGAKTFTIPLLNDSTYEGDETVYLALSAPTGDASLGSTSTAVLTIQDDEASLAFSSATYAVAEGGATATITVTRKGNRSSAVSVDYRTTAGGTATAVSDYTATSGTLSFLANSTSKTFTIPIVDDPDDESAETINLELINVVGNAILGTPNTAILTIHDNDRIGIVSFSAPTYSVDEDTARGKVTITATRTNGAGQAGSVSYASTGGTATKKVTSGDAGDYYFAVGTLSWAAGDPPDKSFDINIYSDIAWEGDETLNLALSSPTGGVTLGAQTTSVLTILDQNDFPGTIALSAPTYTISEDSGTATITAARTGGYNKAVSVSYATTTGGTATSGAHYTATSGTLNWAAGDTTNKTFNISIINNSVNEPDRTVKLALTSPSAGAVLGAQNTAMLTIVEDEAKAGTISFSTPSYSVQENVGTVTITAVRSGGSTGAVSVDYLTDPAGSTATAGLDYTATSGTLTWATGEVGSKTFPLAILADNNTEGPETVKLNLANATGGASTGAQNSTWVTIEGPAVAVLDPWPTSRLMSRWETGTDLTLNGTFSISAGPNRLLLVAVSTKNYSAATGHTYSATYGGKQLAHATVQNTHDKQTWIGYLQEADITARHGNVVTVTINGVTGPLGVYVASYINVDQVKPIRDSGGTFVPSDKMAVNSSPLQVGAGGYAVYNWAGQLNRDSDTENYTENSDLNLDLIYTGIASKPFPSAATTNPVVDWSGSSYNQVSLSIVALNKFGDSLDSDLDTIGDDGDGSGIRGDNLCTGGQTANCDDNCLLIANADQSDTDGDGIGNACDNCPSDANAGQVDSDCDGIGDACSTPVYSPPTSLTFTPAQLVDQGTVSWNDSFQGEAGYRIERKAEACGANTLSFEPVTTISHVDEFTNGIDNTAWMAGATVQTASTETAPYLVADANGSAEVGWYNGAVKLHTVAAYHPDGNTGYNQSYLMPKNYAGIFGTTDFDIQYDFSYSLINKSHLQFNKYASIDAYFPPTAGGNSMYISRLKNAYYTGIQINGESWEGGSFSTSDLSGKLRLIRKDRRLAGYIWNGTGWRLLREHSKQLDQDVAPTWIGATQVVRRNEVLGQDITTSIDNFRFNTVGGQPVAKLRMDLDESQWLGNPGEVIDAAVDGNHGTSFGGVTTTPDSERGTVGSFNGTDDYVEVSGTGTLQNVTDASFTFAVWAKPLSAPAGADTVNWTDTRATIMSRPGMHTCLSYLPTKQFHFSMFSDDSGTPVQTKVPSTGIYDFSPTPQWHYLVGVVDAVNKTASLYVDGVHQQTKIYPGTLLEYATTSYYLGAAQPGTTFTWFYNGMIDDARIYDHALTSTEIQALFNKSMQVGDSGLAPATEYCYRVYPFKNDTCTNWSKHAAETSIITSSNTAPQQPVNATPGNGATDVYALRPSLSASAFADVDAGDTHLASQWLVSSKAGVDFAANVLYNSGTVAPATSHTVSTNLATNTSYYWQVRYQDSKGAWSAYSNDTSFVISNAAPGQPANTTPTNGATGVAITPTLTASAFNDSDNGDTHQASQWVISTGNGAAFDTNIVYDSGAVTGSASHTVAGSGTFGTTYYWKVRYQDSRGFWSAYSATTGFTILTNVEPDQPANISPANGAVNITILPTLTASSFVDGDSGDTHQASQWLISTGGGPAFLNNIFYDSGSVAGSPSHTILSVLADQTVYYWKVRYQDNKGGWSVYSNQTSFTSTTNVAPNQPTNTSPANGAVKVVYKPTLTASPFADNNSGDTHQASQWQVSTGTGAAFAAGIVYDSGTVAGTTSHTVTANLMSASTYFWRVRYQDMKWEWSPYSNDTSFTTSAMLSLWHLDEGSGTIAYDSFGTNNGTVRNGAVWDSSGAFAGKVLIFDGTDDDVVWSYAGGIPANNFTLEAMVKVKANSDIVLNAEATSGATGTSGQRYLFGANFSDTNSGAGVSVGTNGISVYEHGGGYMPALAVYNGPLGTGWNHIVVTYTNKKPRIYLNGYLVRTGLTSIKTNVYAPTQLGGGAYGFFPGTVDEVAVYGTALSEKEILQRCLDLGQCAPADMDSDGVNDGPDNCMREYNPDQADQDGDGIGNVCDYLARWKMDEGSGTMAGDVTGNYNGSLSGGTAWTTGRSGGGLLFDASNGADSVTVNNLLNNRAGDFSIAIWFKFPTGAVNPQWSFGKGDAYRGTGFGIAHWVTTDTPVGPALFLNDGTQGAFLNPEWEWPHRVALGASAIPRGAWGHFVWTIDRTNKVMKVYKNGVYENQQDISILGTNGVTGTSALNFGISATGSAYSGSLDNLAVYDFVLQPGDIQSRCMADAGIGNCP